MRDLGKESISTQNRGSSSPGPRTVGGSRTAARRKASTTLPANISRHPHHSAPDWLSRAGRNENRIAAAGNCLAENFFGRRLIIKIGDVEQLDSGVEPDIHQARRFLYISISPACQKPATPKSSAAARVSELSKFHETWMRRRGRRTQDRVSPGPRPDVGLAPVGMGDCRNKTCKSTKSTNFDRSSYAGDTSR